MFDVVCVGNALVDITVNVPDSFVLGVGLRKGTMTLAGDITQKFALSSIKDIESHLSTGGSASNVALNVACLGGKSSFIGKVGSDVHGSFFESTLSERGVVPKLAKSIDLATGSAIALITPDAERTFSTHLGASATLSSVDVSSVPKSKFFHVEAYLLEDPFLRKLVFSLVDKAKSQGAKISFDLSDPSLIERIKPVILEFLNSVDVVFANEAEAKEFTGESDIAAARALSNLCEIAVVKLGEQGSVIVSGNEQIAIKPEVVVPLNTNGAGDAYAAGFLFALSKDLDLQVAGNIASFVAREVVLVEEASLSCSLSVKVSKFLD